MIIKTYKKTIFNLLLFVDPVTFIEQHKKDISYQIINSKYDSIKKNNLYLIDNLCKDNEKRIEIKNCWEEGDLLSKKRYSLSKENFFHDF